MKLEDIPSVPEKSSESLALVAALDRILGSELGYASNQRRPKLPKSDEYDIHKLPDVRQLAKTIVDMLSVPDGQAEQQSAIGPILHQDLTCKKSKGNTVKEAVLSPKTYDGMYVPPEIVKKDGLIDIDEARKYGAHLIASCVPGAPNTEYQSGLSIEDAHRLEIVRPDTVDEAVRELFVHGCFRNEEVARQLLFALKDVRKDTEKAMDERDIELIAWGKARVKEHIENKLRYMSHSRRKPLYSSPSSNSEAGPTKQREVLKSLFGSQTNGSRARSFDEVVGMPTENAENRQSLVASVIEELYRVFDPNESIAHQKASRARKE